MMRTLTASIALAAGLLTGCEETRSEVVSVLPAYDEFSVRFDERLLGAWEEDDGSRLEFRRRGESYRLIVDVGRDVEESFEVHLFQVGGLQFLDLCSTDGVGTDIPGHFFAKASFDRETLHLTVMNRDWLRTRVVEFDALPHILLSEGYGKGLVVVTAPASELQYFLLRYGADPEAFYDSSTFRRSDPREPGS